jgi:protein-disulfide isomerase
MKRIKQTVLLLLLSAGFLTLQSFSFNDAEKDKRKAAARVSYTGENGQFLLFTVKLDEEALATGRQVKIIISANNQGEIYDETYVAPKKEMVFKINKTDIDKISFTVSINGKREYFDFDIRRSYMEQVAVVAAK